MIQDSDLLQEYVSRNSETAFKELVERHIQLVYSAALQQTGRREVAEDVVQAVFFIFAKKAARLKPGTVVAGWLYRAARLAAVHAVRDECRRSARERAAVELAMLQDPSEDVEWERIAPMLDDGLQRLRCRDRDAVLLRYFQGRSLAEVGSALGCSEEAARKRVDRAVERLRAFFKRRGILVSMAILAETISAQARPTPPPGLVQSACVLGFGTGASLSGTVIHLVKKTMKTMLWSNTPLGVALAFLLVALAGTPLLLRGQPGLVDPTFISRLPITNSGSVTALALQAEGKILVAGSFACFPQVDRKEVPYVGLARLNSDGSVDGSFRSFDDRGIVAMAVQNDGKIIVGGDWQNTNALKRANLCRLNQDGTIDPTFDPGPGTDWRPPPAVPTSTPYSSVVRTVAIQADGSVLIGGDFRQVAGFSAPALARLKPDGSVDRAFRPPMRSGDQVQRILVQRDGKIIVSAGFKERFPAQVSASVLRLNPDGAVDTTFHQSRQIRGSRPLALQKDGQLIACLAPNNLTDLTEPVRLVRLKSDGSMDPAFSAAVGFINVAKPYPQLFAIVSTPGEKIILFGKFNRVNGAELNDLARLNSDGSVDTTFQTGSGFEPLTNLFVKVISAILQPDGKILFGGTFAKVNGVACESLARVVGDPTLWFSEVRFSADGAMQATLAGSPASSIFLESSTDLKTWTRVSETVGYAQILETDLGRPAGAAAFYRAVAK